MANGLQKWAEETGLADRWRSEGRQEGRREGRQEGRREGKREGKREVQRVLALMKQGKSATEIERILAQEKAKD